MPVAAFTQILAPEDQVNLNLTLYQFRRGKRMTWILIFMLAAFSLMEALIAKDLFMLLLGLLFAGMMALMQWGQKNSLIHQSRQMGQFPLFQMPREIQLFPDRVESKTISQGNVPVEEHIYPLSLFRQVIETKEAFYLIFSASKVEIFLKRNLPLQMQTEIQSVLQRACPLYRNVEKKSVQP